MSPGFLEVMAVYVSVSTIVFIATPYVHTIVVTLYVEICLLFVWLRFVARN